MTDHVKQQFAGIARPGSNAIFNGLIGCHRINIIEIFVTIQIQFKGRREHLNLIFFIPLVKQSAIGMARDLQR